MTLVTMVTMTETLPETAPGGQAPTGTAAAQVPVWDLVVRVVHWSLVAAFAVVWLTADESEPVHEIAGYTIAGLVALRLVWGVVGGRYARFRQFVRGPAAALGHLRDMLRGRERRYLGHNPAGAAMIVALLITLSGTALTGWLIAEPERIAGLPELPRIVAPARADDDHDRQGLRDEDTLEEVHETLANLLLVLVVLHVAGVAVASFSHRENLVRAMITGDKRAPGPDDIA